MKNNKTFVFAVGISDYRLISPLRYAARDAAAVAELFGRLMPNAQASALLDRQATKSAILDELANLAHVAGADDTVVVFFSGHGVRERNGTAYFCPVDAQRAALAQSCISTSELTASLRPIDASRLMVLIDACHAGGIGDPRDATSGADLAGAALAPTIEGEGRVILAASRPDELAMELGALRSGLFTHYLLEGLSGAAAQDDGRVWASGLFGYVSRAVLRHGYQRPFQNAIGEDFVVTIVTAASPLTHAVAPAPDARALRKLLYRTYDQPELALLCHDLGLRLEDLWGTTQETRILALIDYCQRHGRYQELLSKLGIDRPELVERLQAPV